MSTHWHCRSFGSILLLLGKNLALITEIPQDSVNGTVGHSVLLPVSYKFTNSSCFPLSFHWTFSNRSDALITCTVLNCSLSAEGAPKHCFAKHFPHAAYRGRVVLFPENASLLLQDLQLSDGGVYSVTFKQRIQTRHITLTVYNPHFSSKNAGECECESVLSTDIIYNTTAMHTGRRGGAGRIFVPTSPRDVLLQRRQDFKGCHMWCYHNDTKKEISSQITDYIIGVSSCLISFLLLFLFCCCIWHPGAVQQKKRRTITQQEVSHAEESPMESTMMRDTANIYARVGDSFEQPQPRATPEVVYMSATFSNPPGSDWALSACAATVELPQVGALNFAKDSPV
ncbi:uncharacterized protein [Struthio camelus]|uniref:uncharacterized protein isoform X1 n=1 Tax=Struthio camelus TaxID=8801 RepID=UPI00051E2AB4|nr:PREDICTED: uncharacterized protein LOC104153990 isoform X1 [Struthio camelus australis]